MESQAGSDDSEVGQQLAEVARPADGHADIADRVLDNQVPADDPGDEFAQGSVGVGIGRTRDRHHRGELGVAQRGESAGERGQQERQHDGRPRARTERIADNGGAGRGEDAGPDGGPDAERREVPFVQGPPQASVLGEVPLEIGDGLAAEQLIHDTASRLSMRMA